MVGAFLRRRDRTVRSLRVEHYSSAVNTMSLETVVLDPASLLVNRKAKQRKTTRRRWCALCSLTTGATLRW